MNDYTLFWLCVYKELVGWEKTMRVWNKEKYRAKTTNEIVNHMRWIIPRDKIKNIPVLYAKPN